MNKEGVSVEANFGPSVKGKAGINYNQSTEGQHQRVNTDGMIYVGSNMSGCTGIDNITPDKDKEYFLSLVVKAPGGDKIIFDNVNITAERDIRKCVWVNNGKFVTSTICPNPKNWRFAPNQGQQRNYPPGYECTQCKRS